MSFGCLFPKIDLRDYKMKACAAADLPEEYRCDEYDSRIKDQKSVSSCVAHALSTILEHHANNDYPLSTNFIYGIQNKEMGRTNKGMYLGDACHIVHKYGDMLEQDCEGNNEVPKCHSIAEKALEDTEKTSRAYNFRIKAYFNCKGEAAIKQALYEYGPVLISIRWYKGCYVDMEDKKLKYNPYSSYNLHAIVVYGWNKDGFLCQNSWGINWGKKGRFILPYDYKIEEAKGIIDEQNEINLDLIVIPKRNKFLDIIYKIINWVINLFTQKKGGQE